MRTVVANFKMNFLKEDLKPYQNSPYPLWIAPQACHIPYFAKTQCVLGAQGCHYEEFGAYTGSISAKTLHDCGVSFVLLGHHEQGEDPFLKKRIEKALENHLQVIYCVSNSQRVVVEDSRIIYAYEPIESIGTGTIKSLSEIEKEVISLGKIGKVFYGGSVSLDSIEELKKLSVEGFLVGKISLNYEIFLKLYLSCLK